MRNAEVVRGALEGIDSVVHLAARVGVGQSMYEPAEYAAANTAGTGVLLEALLDHPVRKLVVASSMSIYGEGAYEPAPAHGADARAARARRLGAARPERRAARAGADARDASSRRSPRSTR